MRRYSLVTRPVTLAFCAAVLICLCSPAARASVLADWNFETSLASGLNVTGTSPGVFAADVGTGTATGLHALASTVWSSPVGNGSAHSLSSNMWTDGANGDLLPIRNEHGRLQQYYVYMGASQQRDRPARFQSAVQHGWFVVYGYPIIPSPDLHGSE